MSYGSRVVSTALVAAIAVAVAACAPPPMSESEACGAWHDMVRASPEDNVEAAAYSNSYYEDWSTRADGPVGDAFAQMAKATRITIDGYDGDTNPSTPLYRDGLFTLTRIRE